MKKVIFVGSTSYSGSTFLGMTLANDPKAFSCGEVCNFFNPTQPYHINPVCGCGDENCTIWQQIKKKGQNNLYETIFDLFPEVEFIVDSSKSPSWIRSQSENLSKKGIRTKNLLIWKTPLEIAHSFQKRGLLQEWEKSWIIYHRLYYTIIEEWKAIKYHRYTNDKTVLEKACKYLEIPFFPDKVRYWEKVHHVLGGNHSAKIHLYAMGSSGYHNSLSKSSSINIEDVKDKHRSIYYHRVADELLEKTIEDRIRNSKYIAAILELLNSYDIFNEQLPQRTWSTLQLPKPVVKLREIKRAMMIHIGRYRYERGSWA